jgi:hypothetical protein
MILSNGCKILVSHRRLYSEDIPRLFVGVVDGYEGGIVKASGHTWIRDFMNGTFYRKPDLRSKIFSIVSGSLFCYQLPDTVELSQLRFEIQGKRVLLVDGVDFKMDLSESETPMAGSRLAGKAR